MHEYKLKNSLLINNVTKLLRQFNKHINSGGSITLDLSDVSNIDSAGLAFLIELKTNCIHNNCKINFINLSEPIINFCKLYQITLQMD
jgi:ABC-type transporter Mla MlaB component